MHDRFVQGAKPTKEHFACIIPHLLIYTYILIYLYSIYMDVRDSQADWGNLRSKWGVVGAGEQIC